ncbi:unnamed protein product [Protopolystoma xenopodis]|uniref:Uncharacterized protein n=1 Tax=Protopolystoma xenopodis TaxID=117903 RepID=A0A3S5AQ29_9PLAT|nr:unnamed protein product [Protopolystoma xenopodis]
MIPSSPRQYRRDSTPEWRDQMRPSTLKDPLRTTGPWLEFTGRKTVERNHKMDAATRSVLPKHVIPSRLAERDWMAHSFTVNPKSLCRWADLPGLVDLEAFLRG